MIAGEFVTTTWVVKLLIQPKLDVAVTEKFVVIVGVITRDEELLVLDQVYVLAPLADKVACCPEQIVIEFATMEGNGLTFIAIVELALQVFAFPITV